MGMGRAALAAMMIGWAGTAFASAEAPEIKQAAHVDTLTLGGDLRLREEYFDYRDAESSTEFTAGARKNDRSRQRFRLRLKSEFKLKQAFTAVVGLASGSGEAVSTNQTFANTATPKPVWIDLAYASWTPKYLGDDGTLKIQGGRIVNPLWRLHTSDLVWDGDYNPEALAESAAYRLPGGVEVFVNAMQQAIHEVGGSTRDPWALSGQVGAEVALPLGMAARLAGAKHTWLNENSGVFGQNPVQLGNTRSSTGILRNEFDVLEFTGQISGSVPWPIGEGTLPWMLQGTFIKNMAARGPDWSGVVTGSKVNPDGTTFLGKSDQGYQVGVQVGKAAAPGSFEVAYYYKRVAWDATVADVSDSDLGEGGLNRKGNIAWVAYTPNGFLTATVKVFNVRLLDKRYVRTAGQITQPDRINRIQADLTLKF